MIARIKGKCIAKYGDIALVEISYSGGSICYEVHMMKYELLSLFIGNEYTFYIKEIIKEDDDILYGFLSFDKRCWFEEFIKLNGLGAKIALSILSAFSTESIENAITTDNCDFFVSVSGVGAKLANRIPAEMKKKVAVINDKICGTFGELKGVEKQNLLLNTDDDGLKKNNTKIKKLKQNNILDKTNNVNTTKDAVEAIVSLGFSRQKAYDFTLSILKKNNYQMSIEDIVKLFLAEIEK